MKGVLKMENMQNLPKHIAIIMDGNRRWAKNNGLSTKEGHKAGSKNLENIARFCNQIGIKYLTVYAFSTENWKRSQEEVSTLMFILKANLDAMLKKMNTENIKIRVIGEKKGIQKDIQKKIDKLVEKTKNNTGLVLNIAFNYGGRAEIVHSVKKIATKIEKKEIKTEEITEDLISNMLYTAGQPEPDLLIRTSNELRTSNFLPWQLVYTEFYFSEKHWPEFNTQDLLVAIQEYQKRNRRFGGRPVGNHK
ncbi:MAG: isoprenyl transferase [Clostridia bacterium]|nr:isoprenyl transferase [Clostridia bacterium]